MGDTHWRYAYDARKMGLGKAAFFEDFAKELTGVNGWQAALDHNGPRSMVIDDLDIEFIAVKHLC